MKQLFALISLIGLLAACSNPAQQAQSNRYFDVAAYIQHQIDTLKQQKPMVVKQLMVEGKLNQKQVRDINWERELELFRQADINKPAYRNSYRISTANPLLLQYSLKEGEKLPVRSLTVALDSIHRQPIRIEAVLVTDNPLYQSERHLLLESGPDGNRHQLKHYRIDGFQQLTFFDRNNFYVEGKLSN